MYFENGKLKSEVTFINENPMNGKEYYESGMLNREENVVEGKRIVTEYNINGTVSSTVTYNNDKGYEGSKFRSFW